MGFLSKPVTVTSPHRFALAGTTHYQKELGRTVLRPKWAEDPYLGSPVVPIHVQLVVEPKNKFDPLAVAVKFGTMTIGYIPRSELSWAHDVLSAATGRVFVDALLIRYRSDTLGCIFPGDGA